MERKIQLIGKPSIVRSKLRSVLSRTNTVAVFDTAGDAKASPDNPVWDAVIFTDGVYKTEDAGGRLYAPAKEPAPVGSKRIWLCRQTAFEELSSGFCRIDASAEDLILVCSDIYGFSGYGTETQFYLPPRDAARARETVFPLLIDDIAFWLNQNMEKACGIWKMQGPDAVSYEAYVKALQNCSRGAEAPTGPDAPADTENTAATPTAAAKNGLILGEHGFAGGLDIVSYQKSCSINIIYKLSTDAMVQGSSVYAMRYILGGLLAERVRDYKNLDFDFVCPIPNTGTAYAEGFAEIGGYALKKVIRKESGLRSFYIENPAVRKQLIERLLTADVQELRGKRVCLIDEAIFTGMTIKVISALLRDMGVADITVMIPTPPCRKKCAHCSIPLKPMLLEKTDEVQAAALLGADRILFQRTEVFDEFMKKAGMPCTECFSAP